MTAAEKHEWMRRAQTAIKAPIPARIRDGSALAASEYKDSCAVVHAFVCRGTQQERAKLAILRLEGVQGRL